MDKPYIFITRQIPDEAINTLENDFNLNIWNKDEPVPRDVLIEEAKKADGLIVMLNDKIDKELLEHSTKLKIISVMAVGYDNIDVNYAAEKGIIVTNTPGILTETTADLTFALLLSTARRITEANRFLHNGEWKSWGPLLLAGQDVYEATIGIIGMGRIGEAVARRAAGFNMNILYHNRNRKLDVEDRLGVEYRSLENLLKESDFIVLLTPLTNETKNLIGEKEFDLMKSTSIFINVSRGATVDENALYKALKEKRIWAAGIDVFQQEPVNLDNPLLELDNLVALPHIGSSSIKTRKNMAVLAAEGIRDVLKGIEPKHIVKG